MCLSRNVCLNWPWAQQSNLHSKPWPGCSSLSPCPSAIERSCVRRRSCGSAGTPCVAAARAGSGAAAPPAAPVPDAANACYASANTLVSLAHVQLQLRLSISRRLHAWLPWLVRRCRLAACQAPQATAIDARCQSARAAFSSALFAWQQRALRVSVVHRPTKLARACACTDFLDKVVRQISWTWGAPKRPAIDVTAAHCARAAAGCRVLCAAWWLLSLMLRC